MELCRLAEKIEQTYPELVRARVVSAERFAAAALSVGDPDRSAHRWYGAERASAFVVRPDGYVAYRSRPADADALLVDLAERLPGLKYEPALSRPAEPIRVRNSPTFGADPVWLEGSERMLIGSVADALVRS